MIIEKGKMNNNIILGGRWERKRQQVGNNEKKKLNFGGKARITVWGPGGKNWKSRGEKRGDLNEENK